jgi:integrase
MLALCLHRFFFLIYRSAGGTFTINSDRTKKNERRQMALIRRNYKDRTTGKTVQSDKYYIDTAYQHRKIRFAAFTSKKASEAHQPLPQDVAEAFTAWKVSKHGKDADRVFDTLTTNHRPSEMIRKDLEAAGLPTEDRAGNEICFHSLRNTYITLLANGSTPAKVIQQLARHSSLDLTMNIYARAEIHSQQAAINSLPKIKQPEKLKKSSG